MDVQPFTRIAGRRLDLQLLIEVSDLIDTETEDWIQEGLKHLLEGRTAVVIAHRLSTITASDRILVFHHGEIREIGTHAELLAKNGIYARLYRMTYAQHPEQAAATNGAKSANGHGAATLSPKPAGA